MIEPTLSCPWYVPFIFGGLTWLHANVCAMRGRETMATVYSVLTLGFDIWGIVAIIKAL